VSGPSARCFTEQHNVQGWFWLAVVRRAPDSVANNF
jgi:hypothetical protein